MRKIRLFLFLPVLALFVYAGYAYSQWTSYHDFEGKCLDCHITVPKPGSAPHVFTKDISLMCKTCHNEETLSHPVDIKPTMEVPANLPLDWKGDITCATCHPIHQQGFGGAHLRTRASGEGFCMQCHSDLESELHKISLGTAHVTGTASSSRLVLDQEIMLDELSLKCMACHDAAFANDSLVEDISTRIFHNTNEIGVSHPIGMSYREAKRKYFGAYRDIDKLPKEIQLFNGIVGCGSCHNPYSKQHNALVMSNERSALCLGCHVK